MGEVDLHPAAGLRPDSRLDAGVAGADLHRRLDPAVGFFGRRADPVEPLGGETSGEQLVVPPTTTRFVSGSMAST